MIPKEKIYLSGYCNLFLLSLMFLLSISVYSQKFVEPLDRGIVAVPVQDNKVFISWRMLGTDPGDIGFNIYKGSEKLNSSPITTSTNYMDNSGTTTSDGYTIRPVIEGREQLASKKAMVWDRAFTSIPLQRPEGGVTPNGREYNYTANDCSVGDLDGDGEYEIILKWNPTNAKDNSQEGTTGNVLIDAYKINGEQLWRIDLGKNIRAGAHYTQFIVYDLDSDGKAEVAMKTADGTRDAMNKVIGNPDADHRNPSGYILSGPEYLTIFNGKSGEAMATVDYLPARGDVCEWGDCYGNRIDRFLAGVAYLDGEQPSLIMTRGYYTRSVIAAWDWKNGELNNRWIFDTNDPGNEKFAGQGNHQLSTGDVDGDGKDEIIFGAMAVDDNGQGLYSTRLGHGDAMHLSDLDPTRPGKEVFQIHEPRNTPGASFRDAHTGEILWSTETADVGRGIAVDVHPGYPGAESWGFGKMYNAKGENISDRSPYANFAVWWDGDLLRELLNGTQLDKWDYEAQSLQHITDFGTYGAEKINGTKSNPNLSADILGDWREEIILRNSENDQLFIFTTTIPTLHKIRTLMHDPQYRVSVAWQNVGYNQPPHTSFFLGDGMEAVGMPPIRLSEAENSKKE